MSDLIAELDAAILDLDAARAALGFALVAKAEALADWRKHEAEALREIRREGGKLTAGEKDVEVRDRANDAYRVRYVAEAEAETAERNFSAKQSILAAVRVKLEKS